MNKSDLIDRIAEKTQTSKAAAARVFEAIFDASSGAIAEAVQAGKHVSIPGFGKFRSKERAARKGRNPQTGREIDIPASTVVSFAPAKTLRDTVKTKGAAGSGARGGAAKSAGGRGTAAAAKSAAKPASKSAAAAKAPAKGAAVKSTTAKSAGAGSGTATKTTAEKSSGNSKTGGAKSGAAAGSSKSSGAKAGKSPSRK